MLLRFTPRGLEFIRVRRRPPVIVTLRQSSAANKEGDAPDEQQWKGSPATGGGEDGDGSLPPPPAGQRLPEKPSSAGVAAGAADRIIIPLRESAEAHRTPHGERSSLSAEALPHHPFMLLLEWNPVTKSHWLKWPMRGLSLGSTGSGAKSAKAAKPAAASDTEVGHSTATAISAIAVTIYPSGTLLRALVPTTGASGKRRRDKREMMLEGELDAKSQQQQPNAGQPQQQQSQPQSEYIPPDLPVEPGEPQPHSLRPGTMMELKHGDVIQFLQRPSLTSDAKVVEYVYAISSRGYADHGGPFRLRKASSSCDTTRRRSGSRTRPSDATDDTSTQRRKRGTASADESDASNTTSDSTTAGGVRLPEIRGSAIRPHAHSDKFRTPRRGAGEPPRRLCQMRANGPLRAQQSIDVSAMEHGAHPMHRSLSASRLGTAPSSGVLPPMVANVRPQMGSQLLQEVVRLQSELQHRESELMVAKEDAAAATAAMEIPKLPVSPSMGNGQLLSAAAEASRSAGSAPDSSEAIIGAYTRAQVNQLIFETFFSVCCTHLEALYQRVSQASVRDNSDIFGELWRALQEPFSFHLMQIHSDCASAFERLQFNNADEREQLYELFDTFLKTRIYPFSKALDSLIPLLKESAHLAKESSRAQSIFTSWTREFSAQLTLSPQWQVVDGKVDDLVNQFRLGHIGKYWLIQSLIPLLKVLVHEQHSKEEDGKRKDKVYRDARAKIAELETLLGMHHTHSPQPSRSPRKVAHEEEEPDPVIDVVSPLQRISPSKAPPPSRNTNDGKEETAELRSKAKRSLPESTKQDDSVPDSTRSLLQTTARTDLDDSELADDCSLPVSASRTPRTASQLDQRHEFEVENDKEQLERATAELLAVDELYESIGKERRRSISISQDADTVASDEASTIRDALISLRESIPHEPTDEEKESMNGSRRASVDKDEVNWKDGTPRKTSTSGMHGRMDGTPRKSAPETIAEYNSSLTDEPLQADTAGETAAQKVELTPLKLEGPNSRDEDFSRAQTATVVDTSRSEPRTADIVGAAAGNRRLTAPPLVIIRSASSEASDSRMSIHRPSIEGKTPSDDAAEKSTGTEPVDEDPEGGVKGPDTIRALRDNDGAMDEFMAAVKRGSSGAGQQQHPRPKRIQSATQLRKTSYPPSSSSSTVRRKMTYDGKYGKGFPGPTPGNSPLATPRLDKKSEVKQAKQREEGDSVAEQAMETDEAMAGSRRESEATQQQATQSSQTSRVSSSKASSHHHLQAMEFWQLAAMLAQMLCVQLPTFTTDAADSEAGGNSLEEKIGVEGELRRRHLAVQSIMAKLSNLLDELRQIHHQEPSLPAGSQTATPAQSAVIEQPKVATSSQKRKSFPEPGQSRRRSSLTPANTYHYTTRAVRENKSSGNV